MNATKTSNVGASFEQLVQADRQKRKNEELANKMLGRGRRKSAPNAMLLNRMGSGPSLASRVGISKQRSTSSNPKPNLDGQWTHDLHKENNPRHGRSKLSGRVDRNDRNASNIQRGIAANGLAPQFHIRNQAGAQMSIRGKASPGPYVVIASNFARGTTAADIEAAVGPIGGEVLSCKLVSTFPTVMAEVLFTDSVGAENVIATFNNQKADGQMLYVYMKQGGPSPIHNQPNVAAPAATESEIPGTSSDSVPQSEPMQVLGETPQQSSSSHNGEARDRDYGRARDQVHKTGSEREQNRELFSDDVMEIEGSTRPNRDEGRLNRDDRPSFSSNRRQGRDQQYQNNRYNEEGLREGYRRQYSEGYRRDFDGGRGRFNGGDYDRRGRW